MPFGAPSCDSAFQLQSGLGVFTEVPCVELLSVDKVYIVYNSRSTKRFITILLARIQEIMCNSDLP